MKTSSRHLISGVAAILLALALPGWAQQTPAPDEPRSSPPAAPVTESAGTAQTAPPVSETSDKSGKLRDLTAGADEVKTQRYVIDHDDFPLGDHTLPKGSRSQTVVSVLGSSTVEGQVDADVVSVLGNTMIGPDATVGGGAVAVLGRLDSQGDVRGGTVSVLGRSEINGHVSGQAVSVFGNMHLGPKAVVDGDVVLVGGKLTRDPAAIVRGKKVGSPVFDSWGDVDWLTTWVSRCLVWGRPLGFGAHLGWAWAVAFSFLAFYLLLALLFPSGIVRCVETMERRPGYSILSSLLTVLLTPVAIVLLAVTVVGALLVPLLGGALLFAGLFGKAVMLAWIGRRFTKLFGDGSLGRPVFAVLIGGLIITFIYTVPFLGLLAYKLLSWLGLGVVVYTVALAMKREKSGPAPLPVPVAPTSASAPAVPPIPAPPVMPMDLTAAPNVSEGFSAELPPVPEVGPAPGVPPIMAETPPTVPPVMPSPPVVPPMPPQSAMPPPVAAVPPVARAPAAAIVTAAYPRAGFFIRLGALALDGLLIAVLMGLVSDLLPRAIRVHNSPGGWLVALAIYGAVMWKLRGTTIGGIVCGLKVVRLDNREIDWPTAIVRSLGCLLSGAVAGFGFIWVAIDDEKQSWHDKVAGTTVVRVPKGVSLV